MRSCKENDETLSSSESGIQPQELVGVKHKKTKNQKESIEEDLNKREHKQE